MEMERHGGDVYLWCTLEQGFIAKAMKERHEMRKGGACNSPEVVPIPGTVPPVTEKRPFGSDKLFQFQSEALCTAQMKKPVGSNSNLSCVPPNGSWEGGGGGGAPFRVSTQKDKGNSLVQSRSTLTAR